MIIPVRCFTCSKVLGDKYRYYLEEVRKKKLAKKKKTILTCEGETCREDESARG